MEAMVHLLQLTITYGHLISLQSAVTVEAKEQEQEMKGRRFRRGPERVDFPIQGDRIWFCGTGESNLPLLDGG